MTVTRNIAFATTAMLALAPACDTQPRNDDLAESDDPAIYLFMDRTPPRIDVRSPEGFTGRYQVFAVDEAGNQESRGSIDSQDPVALLGLLQGDDSTFREAIADPRVQAAAGRLMEEGLSAWSTASRLNEALVANPNLDEIEETLDRSTDGSR